MNCTKMKCIPYEHMPNHVEISNFERLLKHILRVFPSWGGEFNSVGLDHSGSQPFNYSQRTGVLYGGVIKQPHSQAWPKGVGLA